MEEAIVETVESNNVVPIKQNQSFSMTPKSLEEAMKYADLIAKSDLVPNDYKNKPANCLIAMQMGAELGVQPMQAIQNIAVINGRPAVWGDLLPAIVQSHPEFEYMNEQLEEKNMTAVCAIKRRNKPEQIRTFSQADAVAAGLWGKNTWKYYPKRMLQMRARAFAIRDVFADALKGVSVAEDIIDIEPKDYSNITSTDQPPILNDEFITDEQVNTITAFIDENDLDADKWLDYFEKHFKSRNISDIPAKMFEKTMSNLNAAVEHRKKLEAETGASE